MAPPVKRQKRLVVLGSEDEELDANATLESVPTISRAEATKGKPQTSRPISLFFRAGIQAQQPNNQKPSEAEATEVEDLEDLIVDDSSTENVNDHGGRATGTDLDGRKKRPPPPYDNDAATNRSSLQNGSQRFKIREHASTISITTGTSGVAKPKPGVMDMRPWAEKYGPTTLEELMVHKRKVSDVCKWLEDALRGHDYKRLLILKGPSGAGKTATISMLAKAMDIGVLEWQNPAGSQFLSEAYLSMSAHLEDFLGRSRKFNKLALTDRNGNIPAMSSRITDALGEKPRESIILMEEFPNTLSSNSVALRSFRSSVLQHLSFNVPSKGVFPPQQRNGNLNVTPMVFIITETRLTTSAAASESFTAHRLLGPELLNHPCISIIEFNPIASTYLAKALDLVVQKEARQSGRRRVPGPAVLKKLGEVGDIRSAIGSLEFLCLRGENEDDLGGRVVSRAKKRANISSTLTKLEKDLLAMVTQRESTLGLFHAVGKVVYNKRNDFTDSGAASEPPTQPPHHLFGHVRPRIAQVSADQLIDETGTDIETFIAALHENFVLSCEGKSFTDNLNGCIDALSDSDILGSLRGGRYGSFEGRGNYTFQGAPSDTFRQDEIRFQVAVRGLLFSLPDPVRRRAHPISGESGGRNDSHKIIYPTSIRLSRQMEDIDGLVGQWTDRLRASGVTLGKAIGRHGQQFTHLPLRREVQPFSMTTEHRSRSDEDGSEPFRTSLLCTKNELIAERLPYLTKIRKRVAGSTHLHELERITQFHATTPSGNEVSEDEDIREGIPLSGWTTDGRTEAEVGQASKATNTLVLPVEEEVGQLYLSADDIEDD